MTSFADLNMATFDPDNFFPPADTSTSTNGLVQPLQPTTSNLPAVQIDEEVILKHKRRKQLKISDQYNPFYSWLIADYLSIEDYHIYAAKPIDN
jgi:hypothetical protein